MPPRIGVYVCECGPNIKEALDTEEMVAFAGALEGVVLAKPYHLLCAAQGTALIIADIKIHKLERIVIAACSPREHERTFKEALKKGGINPYLLQMANIREQCAWVTQDRQAGTEKAKALLRAAVLRVIHHGSLEEKSIDCQPNVLVIGSGVAGVSAALTLAQRHRRVYLVERLPCIGGHAGLYEELFPEATCTACLLAQPLDQLLHHAHIEVLTCSEVKEVLGEWGNFTVRVEKKTRLVEEKACTGCRACLSGCPVEVSNEFNQGLDKRKAIYIPYDGSLPNIASIDKTSCLRFRGKDCTVCRDACPFGAVDYAGEDETAFLNVGAIIVATGFDLFDPGKDSRFGYHDIAEVYTSLEFERLLNQSGPTGGKIRLKNGNAPDRIALIHCVGSRSESHHGHCSGICCAYLLKFAIQIHKQLPDVGIEQIYVDFCLPGKGAQDMLSRAKRMPRFSAHQLLNSEAVRLSERADGISVCFTDKNGQSNGVTVDMVVLGEAMIGAASARPLRAVLDIEQDTDGFWREAHSHLAPVATRREGIFVAGCGQGPRDIPGAVAHGQAAAGCVLQRLIPGEKLPLYATAATIDGDICSGCKTCAGACECGAISYDGVRKQCSINPVLCRGCGNCVAACPSGAASAPHFTDAAIGAEISGLLDTNRGGDPE